MSRILAGKQCTVFVTFKEDELPTGTELENTSDYKCVI